MVLLCFPTCAGVLNDTYSKREVVSAIPVSWCIRQDDMVQKKLSSEGRLLAKMKVPWEVAEASIETVQPSEEDLCKVFLRWGSGAGFYDMSRSKSRHVLGEGNSILHKIDISPDFSAFTHSSQKKGSGRERSVSCPLGPRSHLPRRRKNTDFDAIIRDISDDSLYLRFKNNLTASATRIDTNNNTTACSNSSSPPVSLTSSSSGELKEICRSEDDIWTDISLDGVTYDEPSRDIKDETSESFLADNGKGTSKEVDSNVTGALPSPDIVPEERDEYWKFTQDVYRTLTADDETVCSLTITNPGTSLDLKSTGSAIEVNSSLANQVEDDRQALPLSVRTDDKAKLIGELLQDIYPKSGENSPNARRRSDWITDRSKRKERKKLVRFHSESGGFLLDIRILPEEGRQRQPVYTYEELNSKYSWELVCLVEELRSDILNCGKKLVSELQSREDLAGKRQESCDVLTAYLQAASEKRSEDTQMKFSVEPGPGDTGFTEWATAMKMVARLPEGVPQHFRKTLWLTLAEKHLSSRGVSWQQTECALFSESCNPGDEELSVQIVKDLHRTGCSLFCGVSGQHNQAVLKRVLLAFARWNKNVGYCQGLNMLAALILQVMQGSQTSTVKVMIYLIEGVLPESYFGQNLRGLSVDMTVFRDLLRLKLPHLSKHLDLLQHESKESGTSYEPPLMDVFTMQWFLTIFSNCLPQATVLRVWDLLFLEGNEVLLKTALAIWQYFSERILAVKSADEFYSSMAVYTREMLELGLMDPNNLIRAIDTLSIPEVAELREKYVYNITPWTVATVAKKGLRLLYDPYDSDEDHQNNWTDGGERSDGSGRQNRDSKITPFSNHPDREKIALDIGVLKKQYMKLRERQRQAHIIFTAACSSESLASNTSPALNHLLLGKSALLSMKGRRIEGTIPPPMNRGKVEISGETLHWRDATDSRQSRTRRKSNRINKITYQTKDEALSVRSRSISSSSSSGSSSSSTELCDDSSESGDDIPNETQALDTEQTEEVTDDIEEESETNVTTAISTSTIGNPETEMTRADDDEMIDESDKEEQTGSQIIDANDDEDAVGGGVKRRNSERALMQILRENSEILRRIQSQSAIRSITEIPPEEEQIEKDDLIRELKLEVYRNSIKSLDREVPEPEDIAEIRRKYSINKQWSLDSTASSKKPYLPETMEKPKSFDLSCTTTTGTSDRTVSPTKPFSPFPVRSPRKKSQLGVQLGLYSPDSDS